MNLPLRVRVDTPPVIGDASENRGPRLLATTWTLTAFAAIFLGLRIASKLWRRKALWWDDYVLVVSWVSLLRSPSHPVFFQCSGRVVYSLTPPGTFVPTSLPS